MDEAHNLVERSREMYSAIIYKEDFLLAKKILSDEVHMGETITIDEVDGKLQA